MVPEHSLSLVIRSLSSSFRCPTAPVQPSPAPLHKLEECGNDPTAAVWPGACAVLLKDLLPPAPLPGSVMLTV